MSYVDGAPYASLEVTTASDSNGPSTSEISTQARSSVLPTATAAAGTAVSKDTELFTPRPVILTASSYHPGETTPVHEVFTQPSACSTRWVLLYTSRPYTHITSGAYAYAEDGFGFEILVKADSAFWLSCYLSSTTPVYSPGICFSGQTSAAVTSYTDLEWASTGQEVWQALCCPR